MTEYLHIPRASLSASTISSDMSNASSRQSNASRRSSTMSQQPQQIHAVAAAANSAPKAVTRSSRYSQSSAISDNSTRSNASNSVLLTAANLQRHTQIYNNNSNIRAENNYALLPNVHASQTNNSSTYNVNLLHALTEKQQQLAEQVKNSQDLQSIKIEGKRLTALPAHLKDTSDSASVASSMHFTIVNGEFGGGAGQRGERSAKPKRQLCSHGRQVTVLIISMSLVFLLLISGMVYALEMRARVMPKS